MPRGLCLLRLRQPVLRQVSTAHQMASNTRKRPTTSRPADGTSERAKKRARGTHPTLLFCVNHLSRTLRAESLLQKSFRTASLALSRGQLLLLPESQFTLGGVAACPFATLGLGSAILEKGAFEDTADQGLECKRFAAALQHAVSALPCGGHLIWVPFRLTCTRRPGDHCTSTPTQLKSGTDFQC